MNKKPTKRTVCPECSGTGRVLCDALRGVDIGPEHLEDPDFTEDYFGGAFDVQCPRCNGQKELINE